MINFKLLSLRKAITYKCHYSFWQHLHRIATLNTHFVTSPSDLLGTLCINGCL